MARNTDRRYLETTQQRLKTHFARGFHLYHLTHNGLPEIKGTIPLMKNIFKRQLCHIKWRRENSNMGSQVIRSTALFPVSLKKKKKVGKD